MKIRMLGLASAVVLFALSAFDAGVVKGADNPPPAAAPVKQKLPFPQHVHAQVAAILDALESDKDYSTATDSLQVLFDQSILYSMPEKFDSIREADFALRMVSQLNEVSSEKRDAMLPYLRKHEKLAQTLVFLMRKNGHWPYGVYQLLDNLRQNRGDKLDQYATLAAALCVVQNKPHTIHANENAVTSVDPLEIFDYYVKNESRMRFGIRNVPAELLIFVVDTTATIKEMEWALSNYQNTDDVGKLFFKIKYDYGYLKSGGDKQLTVKGFNLPNILRYGGVCVDQSYFATTVGKSIGVPTAMDEGTSGQGGHAWVGYLQATNNRAWWNFDSGRYESFQGVEGSVEDPQSRKPMPDSYVSLLAEMIGTKPIDRQNTVALTDAAQRLIVLEKDNVEVAAPPAAAMTAGSMMVKPRARNYVAQLVLIESALKQSAAYTPAWFTVRDLAIDHKLTIADKRKWSDRLLALGAKKYPEFTLSVLFPMVESIDDPREQDSVLTSMQPLFASRKDLSASILMAQAKLWQSHEQTDRACKCYLDVIDRYCNDGPFVLDALTAAEKLLKGPDILVLYKQAWSKTKKPGDWSPEFVAESNWFKIGTMYAKKLSANGDSAAAADVTATLKG